MEGVEDVATRGGQGGEARREGVGATSPQNGGIFSTSGVVVFRRGGRVVSARSLFHASRSRVCSLLGSHTYVFPGSGLRQWAPPNPLQTPLPSITPQPPAYSLTPRFPFSQRRKFSAFCCRRQ